MAAYTITIPDTAPVALLAAVARRALSTDPVQVDPVTAALTDHEAITRWTLAWWARELVTDLQRQAQIQAAQSAAAGVALLNQTTITPVV